MVNYHQLNRQALQKRSRPRKKWLQKKAKDQKPNESSQKPVVEKTKDIGLTLRIEINLPADGTKETYDNIFKSIKENFIDG